MLISLTVGKVDAGVTVLLTPDKRLIEFPSILLPPNISSGSIVDITVSQNTATETSEQQKFRALQDRIFNYFGASEPCVPVLRCCNATQTSVVLEWDPVDLATADLISLSLYRNGQKAGNIPRPLQMHSTKISGLAVESEYIFHLVLRTSAGTRISDKVTVRTHKMTDLSGITITTGILPGAAKERLALAVERMGAKLVDGVRIDTTHFVTTEGRGTGWEKAVEMNIPVVRPEWVEACESNGRILGVTKFYLDAMRVGSPSEEHGSPAAAPELPAKDEPGGQDRRPAAHRHEHDRGAEDDGPDDGEAGGEPRRVDSNEIAPDQTVPGAKDEANAAAGPEATRRSGESEADAAQEADEAEDSRVDRPGASPKAEAAAVATPDAASFQEVEL